MNSKHSTIPIWRTQLLPSNRNTFSDLQFSCTKYVLSPNHVLFQFRQTFFTRQVSRPCYNSCGVKLGAWWYKLTGVSTFEAISAAIYWSTVLELCVLHCLIPIRKTIYNRPGAQSKLIVNIKVEIDQHLPLVCSKWRAIIVIFYNAMEYFQYHQIF